MLQDYKYTAAISNTPILVTNKFKYLVLIDGFNDNNATAYVQMFDQDDASNVTLGVTTPDWVHPIPLYGGHDVIYTPNDYFQGVKFKNGLVVAATTTRSGATALSSNVDINLLLV